MRIQFLLVAVDAVACPPGGIDVPLDEAVVPEAVDRLMYLGGLACYARWRTVAAGSYPSPAGPARPAGHNRRA